MKRRGFFGALFGSVVGARALPSMAAAPIVIPPPAPVALEPRQFGFGIASCAIFNGTPSYRPPLPDEYAPPYEDEDEDEDD